MKREYVTQDELDLIGHYITLEEILFTFWENNEVSKVEGKPYDITYEEYREMLNADRCRNLEKDDEKFFQYKDFQNYYKNTQNIFSAFLKLFNVNTLQNDLFDKVRAGYNSLIYQLREYQAVFIYEFFARKKKLNIWSKILKIDNSKCDGFLSLYQQTDDRPLLLEQIEFVINGLLDIHERNRPANTRGYNELKKNLYIVTQYNQIKCLEYINNLVPLLSSPTVDDFARLPHPYTTWGEYVKLFSVFQDAVKHEVDKFNYTFEILKNNPTHEVIVEHPNDDKLYQLLRKPDRLMEVITLNEEYVYMKISDVIDRMNIILPPFEECNTTTEQKRVTKKGLDEFFESYQKLKLTPEEKFFWDIYVATL